MQLYLYITILAFFNMKMIDLNMFITLVKQKTGSDYSEPVPCILLNSGLIYIRKKLNSKPKAPNPTPLCYSLFESWNTESGTLIFRFNPNLVTLNSYTFK